MEGPGSGFGGLRSPHSRCREPTARMRQIRSYTSTRRRRRSAGLVERRPSLGVATRSRVRILPLSPKCRGWSSRCKAIAAEGYRQSTRRKASGDTPAVGASAGVGRREQRAGVRRRMVRGRSTTMATRRCRRRARGGLRKLSPRACPRPSGIGELLLYPPTTGHRMASLRFKRRMRSRMLARAVA